MYIIIQENVGILFYTTWNLEYLYLYMIYESYKGNIIIIKLYKKTSNKMVPKVSFDKDITPNDQKFHLMIYNIWFKFNS